MAINDEKITRRSEQWSQKITIRWNCIVFTFLFFPRYPHTSSLLLLLSRIINIRKKYWWAKTDAIYARIAYIAAS